MSAIDSSLALVLISGQVARRVVSLALDTFSRIDGLIVNHGTLGECNRIADSTPEEWRNVFDVNFFSALAFVSILRLDPKCRH